MRGRKQRTEVQYVAVDWEFITDEEDSDDLICIQLTKGQRRLLAAILEPQRWTTRWENAPGPEDLTDYVDALQAALMGDLCNVPIIDMRNQDCTLEVRYSDNPEVWVAIGQFFPLDASCIITDKVRIRQAVNGRFQAIAIRNDDATPANNTSSEIGFYSFDPTGVLERLQGFISAQWSNVSQSRGEIDIGVAVADTRYDIVRTGLTNQSMIVQFFPAIGHNQGLRVLRPDAAYGTNRLLDVLTGSRLLHSLDGNGMAEHYRRLTEAGLPAAALNLVSFSDGPGGVGQGPALAFKAKSSTTENVDVAAFEATWDTATHAARAGRVRLAVYDYFGKVYPFEITAQDGATALGFHGVNPITRPTHEATTEIEAINEINATLAAYGLIVDDTNVVADTGGGEPEFVPVKEVITEVYRDLTQATYGLSNQGSGYGTFLGTFGWSAGVAGFKVNRNYSPQTDFYAVRVTFDTEFTNPVEMTLGLELGTPNEKIVRREIIEAGSLQHQWEGIVWSFNTSTCAVQLWAWDAYNPLTDGDLFYLTLDVAHIGTPNLEADSWDDIYPFGTHQVIKYVDLMDVPLVWDTTPGGPSTPTREFIMQE